MLHHGRLSKKVEIRAIRELTVEDLELLKAKRTSPVVAKLRDPHHRVARLLASGMRPAHIAQETGYSIARIYTLACDPTFMDQVAKYRADVHEAYVASEEERYRLANDASVKALRTIVEHFDKADEEGELVPLSSAVKIFDTMSDRTGLVRKSVQTNVNVDFAARLEKARQIRDQTRLPIIDTEATLVSEN